MNPFFDVHQAASHCDCSIRWIQKLANQNSIGSLRGNRLAFSQEDLDRLRAIRKEAKVGNPKWRTK